MITEDKFMSAMHGNYMLKTAVTNIMLKVSQTSSLAKIQV